MEHKHAKRIINLQCWVIGINSKHIDASKERWFMEYSWSKRRENFFVFLLTLYLEILPRARMEILSSPWKYKGKCKKSAKEWVWQYGWKYKSKSL